jgi:hypothetical protein
MTEQKLGDEDLTKRMYAALKELQAGDKVPADIYIADYKDGEIPDWRVAERTIPNAENKGLFVLYLEDMSNIGKTDLFNPVGRPVCKMVIATPRKILGSPTYMPVEGREYGPPMLHDLVQNARIHRKVSKGKRNEVAA